MRCMVLVLGGELSTTEVSLKAVTEHVHPDVAILPGRRWILLTIHRFGNNLQVGHTPNIEVIEENSLLYISDNENEHWSKNREYISVLLSTISGQLNVNYTMYIVMYY